MLDTYIKNRGVTKTIIHDNNHNSINEINWDADYDGNVANISIDLTDNGRHGHYNVTLDNNDLANILNVPSVTLPIDKRLKRDFKQNTFRHDPNLYQVQFDNVKSQSIQELLQSEKPTYTHISSPLPNEELIVPLTINEKTIDNYTLTPRRRHRRMKSHKTHRVYKRPKSASKKRTRSKRTTFATI